MYITVSYQFKGIIWQFEFHLSLNFSPILFQFEFFESFAGACTFAGAYVLAIEWVNSKYRVLSGTIISLAIPLGDILLGFVAMYIHDFRLLIRVLYTPGLLVIVYFWIVPESVRWLLVTGRVDRAIKILKRTASVNGKELSNKSIDMLRSTYTIDEVKKASDEANNVETHTMLEIFNIIIKSKRLSLRLLNGCLQWAVAAFCYYGLSMIATHIRGENRYVSFIIVVAMEIPGMLISTPLLNCMRRKILLFTSFFITAIATGATSWIPEHHSTIILIFFMIGKAASTCGFTSLYIFTAEQWPTGLRTTIMNTCSMIGRVGAMVAPQTVILVNNFETFSY